MPKAAQPPENPPRRDRSRAARIARRAAKAEREQRIVDGLARGLKAPDIAAAEGIGERGMRKAIRSMLARPSSGAARDHAASEIARLNKDLGPAFDAMAADDVEALSHVVALVRALDRFHGASFLPRIGGRAQNEDGTEWRRKPLKKPDSDSGVTCGLHSRPREEVTPRSSARHLP